jgi:hypothetical protein
MGAQVEGLSGGMVVDRKFLFKNHRILQIVSGIGRLRVESTLNPLLLDELGLLDGERGRAIAVWLMREHAGLGLIHAASGRVDDAGLRQATTGSLR